MESSKKAKMDDTQADRSSSSRAVSVVDNLPNQIVMEILSRLPIRTLMATRCVCKSWLLLTSGTEFAKFHSTRAPTELLRHHRLETYLALGEFEMRKSSAIKVHFNFLFQLPNFTVWPNSDVNFEASNYVKLVNSCRGFLCYFGFFGKFAVIWNPIMGQFITVPAPKRVGNVLGCTNYGFGFSSKENKFKLLRMLRVTDPVTGLNSSKDMAEVFTFEEGSFSWKNVGYCPYLFKEPMPGAFLEGAIHWVIAVHTFHIVIVSFDFDSEKFVNVPLPPHLDKVEKSQVKIGVLGDCLCLTDFTGVRIRIWVMKEYGVQDSWTKAFSIVKESRNREMNDGLKIIKYLENGEILMLRCNGCLLAYHPAKERFRSLGRDPNCTLETIAYTPSLFRLEDAMMRNHVYTLNVKLRPVMKIYRSLLVYDRADPKQFWRLNEESPQQECSEASLTNDDIHVPITEEERHESVSGMGVVQTPASSSATHVTTEVPWEQMKTMVEKLGEELRKERQQRQELEQRLQNETEHLKQQNQKLEESLHNEEAKVEELKVQIQRSNKENQQMALQLVDEMRAHLAGSH